LQRVQGVTPSLMARLARTLTVYSRQQGVNLATATRDVLLAVPGVTAEQVDAFIAAREDALKNRLPVPPFPQAQGFAAAASPVWRIHVLARATDGVTFARDAVLRPMSDPRRPLVTLLWQEGTPDPMSELPDTGKSAQENGTGKP
jgi:general secretion pathway protein K